MPAPRRTSLSPPPEGTRRSAGTRPGPGGGDDPVTERRTRTIDTFIDLVLGLRHPPRPEDVAEAAGISPATLYRYFASLDELRRAAADRVLDRFADRFAIPAIGTGSRRDRIARFSAARLELHETLHPLELLLRANARTDDGAAELVDTARRLLAEQVRLHFDDELRGLSPARREDAVASIAVLTSVESWDQFRHSLGRTPTQIRRAWTEAVDRILSAR